MTAPSEIAAAIRERREIFARLETQKERMQKTEEIILATFLGDKKAGEFYWLDGYEARDEEVKALRGEGATLRELQRLDSDIIDTLRADLADVTEERNKLGAEISDLLNTQCEYAAELRADLHAAREALATRGELVALDREKVRKVVYESLYHHDALDRITDAVMQFGTPAQTLVALDVAEVSQFITKDFLQPTKHTLAERLVEHFGTPAITEKPTVEPTFVETDLDAAMNAYANALARLLDENDGLSIADRRVAMGEALFAACGPNIPAITEERAVAVLVEKGWMKKSIAVWKDGAMRAQPTDEETGLNHYSADHFTTALVPPATATENK